MRDDPITKADTTKMREPLLAVRGLKSEFVGEDSTVRAVDGVSFDVNQGEVLGIVGESGCGKSATSLSILGLLPKPQGRVVAGSVVFEGQDLLALSEAQLQRVRGNRIAMIFQDPMASLNPYLTIREQLAEVGELHLGLTRAEAVSRAVELLDRVRIADAHRRINDYPHQLSGGMRQRVMIAMALLCKPKLLIADEPTTALDVTIQAQILELLLSLRESEGLSVILITHDLAVVSAVADRVLVMYAGCIVEEAPARQLFSTPAHPYTEALLRSLPGAKSTPGERLRGIDGFPPQLDRQAFSACRFLPRCDKAISGCEDGEPELLLLGEGRKVRCILSPGTRPT